MKRRRFIGLFGGAAVAWPLATAAQQASKPVVAFLRVGSPDTSARYVAAFRKGLFETGYTENQNVTVEYHWFDHFDRAPALVTDLVRRQVAVIVTPGFTQAAVAAKAATTSIPIVFGVPGDPVQLGLVGSLSRPGGNVTGVNFFATEIVAKRLRLLHDLVPKAVRIAAFLNPANPTTTAPTLRDLQEAAPAIGLQTQILNATTIAEIDAAFGGFERDPPDALFVGPDSFFFERRFQFVELTARHKIPAIFAFRAFVEAGGLMSYGTDLTDMFRQVGVYTGRVLKGARPADLPVLQSTKFEFVLNLSTAKALGIEVPSGVLSIVDEVID